MELVPVCLCVLAPANLCPCEIWSLCEVGVRRCTRLVHRATVLLRVSTVVAFCAALIGGGAVGAKAEITASVPAGVHWRASPEGMPLWGPNRFWPGSGLVLRCLGPGFTVLALGPGFRPIIICTAPGRVEGGGQPVLSFEQCFILFCSFPLIFAFVVGGRGFEFCVFIIGCAAWSGGGVL